MRKLLVVTALLLFAGITFGQTLKKGAVIGTHTINVILKDDVTMNQFLDFLENTWKAEIDNLDGITVFILKGDRGVATNKYGFIYYCESLEVRNKYFPVEDETPEEFNELYTKLQNEILKYVISMTTEYTDWIVL